MAAQTATRRVTKTVIQKYANLQRELEGAAAVDISTTATVTLTFVWTTATGAITLNYAST